MTSTSSALVSERTRISLVAGPETFGRVGIQHDLAHRGPGARGQSAGDRLQPGLAELLRVRQTRRQELAEACRLDARERLGLGQHPLLDHLHGDPRRGLGRALRRPALQHEEAPSLDRELEVLGVPVARLETYGELAQLLHHLGNGALEAVVLTPAADLRAGERARGSPARDDLFALHVGHPLAHALASPVLGLRLKRTPAPERGPTFPYTMA